MGLKYVVLTSVNRDDLPDGGAAHYAAAVRAIKRRNPGTAVEALTPDFQGVMRDVHTVLDSGLDVFAQNVETVRRLTHPVRDPRAGYEQTIGVLRAAKAYRPDGADEDQPDAGLGRDRCGNSRDPARICAPRAVDILTLGQYLRPTPNHLNVERFVTPASSIGYRERALELGFLECVSGPLVRSSYRAEQALARNNAGLDNRASSRRQRRGIAVMSDAPLIRHLGLTPYEPTWRAMQKFTDERQSFTADEIWFVEHPPVFTLGIERQPRAPAAPGDIPVVQIDRGGQVTYHGPGQLVIYPLIDLRRRPAGRARIWWWRSRMPSSPMLPSSA